MGVSHVLYCLCRYASYSTPFLFNLDQFASANDQIAARNLDFGVSCGH